MSMTQEMADEFNYKLAMRGSMYRVLKCEGNDYAWEITIPKDPYENHRPAIYPNKDFYDQLEQHYMLDGIKITYNNTRSTFWTDDRPPQHIHKGR